MTIAIGIPEILVSSVGDINSVQCFEGYKRHGVLDNVEYFISAKVFAENVEFFFPVRERVTVYIPDCNTNLDVRPALVGDDCNVQTLRGKFTSTLEKDMKKQSPANELSAREIEVLRELATGKTFKEIADALCISTNTVVSHRKNISSKLGIRSVSGLSLYALMNGFL